jgi:ketosteroid isomerase-like protein
LQTQQTIERLYAAFAQLDAPAMGACYADDAEFDDEVFSLRGRPQVAGMWSMLCDNVLANGRVPWRLQWSDVQADATTGHAHWEAWYRFSATSRDVHNRIDAEFRFGPDGRIATHRDRFGFWGWSRQALGLPGLLLGWTPMLRNRVRQRGASSLRRYMDSAPKRS